MTAAPVISSHLIDTSARELRYNRNRETHGSALHGIRSGRGRAGIFASMQTAVPLSTTVDSTSYEAKQAEHGGDEVKRALAHRR